MELGSIYIVKQCLTVAKERIYDEIRIRYRAFFLQLVKRERREMAEDASTTSFLVVFGQFRRRMAKRLEKQAATPP